jgi:hypothetical protein
VINQNWRIKTNLRGWVGYSLEQQEAGRTVISGLPDLAKATILTLFSFPNKDIRFGA